MIKLKNSGKYFGNRAHGRSIVFGHPDIVRIISFFSGQFGAWTNVAVCK